MRSGARRWAAVTVVASVAIVTGPPTSSEAAVQTFSGHFGDTEGSEITLTVKLKHGQPTRGRFEATQLNMACGSTPLDDPVAIGSTKVRFVDRATFTADRYRNSDGVESYLRVKGEVDFKSGLATGLAAAYVNPAPAGPSDSECSTLGWADWKVVRHRRAAAKPHRIAGTESTDADDGAEASTRSHSSAE